MNSIKCKNCGLSNFPTEYQCRRCGYSFVASQKPNTEPKRKFSVWSLLMVVGLLAVVYYFYSGVGQSMTEVNANDAKRVAEQPAERPLAPGVSRQKYDQTRARQHGDLVSNSAALQAHQKHIDDTQKLMQQASNSAANR